MLAGHPFSYPDLPRPPPAITRAVTEYLSTHAVLAVRVGLPASDTASGTTLDRRTPAGAHDLVPAGPRGDAEFTPIITPCTTITAAPPAPVRGRSPLSDTHWEMLHTSFLTYMLLTYCVGWEPRRVARGGPSMAAPTSPSLSSPLSLSYASLPYPRASPVTFPGPLRSPPYTNLPRPIRTHITCAGCFVSLSGGAWLI